ncbi:MAG: hypothetical protein ACLPJH_18040 [Myxococcaceae bacterium]
MRPRFCLSVSAVLSLSGCAPAPVYLPKAVPTSTIYKPAVLGPHGEHLVEIACGTPDACMEFGRQVCQGDFDLITHSDLSITGGKTADTFTILMLIQCKSLLPSVSAPQPGAQPDK